MRNQADVQDWKIEGEAIVHMNVPYFDLLEGVEGILSHIPYDRELLVVCAKEGSSIMVAEMLSEAGRTVHYLEGGMKAWSEHLEPVKIGDLTGGGELYQFVRMGKGCLSYMIMSNGEAAIVDAARMTDVYIHFAKSIMSLSRKCWILIFMRIIFLAGKNWLNRLVPATGCRQKMQKR